MTGRSKTHLKQASLLSKKWVAPHASLIKIINHKFILYSFSEGNFLNGLT